jgi:cytochrome c-type biogenesis protein CcmE
MLWLYAACRARNGTFREKRERSASSGLLREGVGPVKQIEFHFQKTGESPSGASRAGLENKTIRHNKNCRRNPLLANILKTFNIGSLMLTIFPESEMARKNSPVIYAVALLLFLGGVGYIVWSNFAANRFYFFNVAEALAMPAGELQSARLFGTVAEDGITRPEGRGVRFLLQDAENPAQIVWVDYRGAVPDAFQPGAEVIVEGGMGATGFEARTLMTKCPSKYEKQNRTSPV